MRIIRDLQKFDYPNPVATIGNFDGVHIGHQKIFSRVIEKAKEINGAPIAITFDPHPVRALAPERGLKMITSFEDKVRLMSEHGIKAVICIGFSREFAKTDPEDFIKNILIGSLGVKWVIVGHNYAFGKGKKGTPALLRRRGKKYDFGISVVRYATVYDDIVSSSRIRSLLFRGRVCEASKMLGRAYHIEGAVVKGAGRGTPLLHTPTANIEPVNEIVPKEGVYAVRASLDNHIYDGVANIGSNPTFGNPAVSCEVHIFGFHKDILGRKLRLHFLDRIRDEKKFSGVPDLQEQIKKDIEKAKEILAKRKDRLLLQRRSQEL
jgi:riboflavin kinase/FMN adenylyltransferase